jgi:hypothetical protein
MCFLLTSTRVSKKIGHPMTKECSVNQGATFPIRHNFSQLIQSVILSVAKDLCNFARQEKVWDEIPAPPTQRAVA